MNIDKKWLVVFIVSFVVFLIVGFLTWRSLTGKEPLSLLSPWGGEIERKEKRIFDKYSFPYLAARNFEGSEITLEKVLRKEEGFTSWLFYYYSDGKKITGMANIPDGQKKFPVVIMVRGWVPDEIYQTGVGTQPMADFLARSGFLTLAPDFLGFGGSDPVPTAGTLIDLVDRFEKPVAILSLLACVGTLPQADQTRVFMWAHSNGGQVALSVLEILGKANLPAGRQVPTVLWAPVTKPFPYNVLYYSDETEDKGKYLRRLLSEFEKDYDVDLFSIDKYLSDITAPLQLHQGTADDSVPLDWSNDFYNEMKILKKEIEYFKYDGADHNLRGGWGQAAERSLEFYKRYL